MYFVNNLLYAFKLLVTDFLIPVIKFLTLGSTGKKKKMEHFYKTFMLRSYFR